MDSCFCEVTVVIYQCMYVYLYVFMYVRSCTRARHVICVPKTDVTCPKTEFTKECFHLRKIYKQRNTKYE